MMAPATDGPTTRVIFCPALMRAMPLVRRSLETSEGTIACWAGFMIAWSEPLMKAKSSRCHACTNPVDDVDREEHRAQCRDCLADDQNLAPVVAVEQQPAGNRNEEKRDAGGKRDQTDEGGFDSTARARASRSRSIASTGRAWRKRSTSRGGETAGLRRRTVKVPSPGAGAEPVGLAWSVDAISPSSRWMRARRAIVADWRVA